MNKRETKLDRKILSFQILFSYFSRNELGKLKIYLRESKENACLFFLLCKDV